MKILIIDENKENQAHYAERLKHLSPSDVETLDLHVMLIDMESYEEHVEVMDLVILGSGLGTKAINTAKKVKDLAPKMNIIIYANREHYNGQLIRQAQHIGVRRVLNDYNDDIEFLQELYAIDAEYRRKGKLTYGKVTVLVSPKGGAGTTSLAASLGEVSSRENKKTLLWDLDFATQDLSRALSLYGRQRECYEQWIDNPDSLSLKSFIDSTVPIDNKTALLCPPSDYQSGYELAYQPEGNQVLQKIVELARYNYENIIIDLAQPNCPGAESIIQYADEIIILTGECALSVTACEFFIEKITPILGNHLESVRLLVTGGRHSINEIKESLQEDIKLPERSWTLPELPLDIKARDWPASGRTLYSAGGTAIKAAVEEIAANLEIVPEKEESYSTVARGRLINFSFLQKKKNLPYVSGNDRIEIPEEKESKENTNSSSAKEQQVL